MWDESQILLSFNVNSVFVQDPTNRAYFNMVKLGKKQGFKGFKGKIIFSLSYQT